MGEIGAIKTPHEIIVPVILATLQFDSHFPTLPIGDEPRNFSVLGGMKSNSIRQDSPEKFEAIEQNTIELPLDKIRISNRTRRKLGDISNLAESMAKLGLLHAVV